MSFGEIVKELGVSRSAVSSICKRANERCKFRCKKCGVLLKQTNGHRKKVFCSDRCRKAWWRLIMEATISSTMKPLARRAERNSFITNPGQENTARSSVFIKAERKVRVKMRSNVERYYMSLALSYALRRCLRT